MLVRMILVAAAGIVIGLGAAPALIDFQDQPAAAPAWQIADVGPEAATRIVPESEAQLQLSFAPVVKAVAPSVVNVYATTVSEESLSPFANDPFFRHFF